jgi:L-lactate dehydrogenase
LRLLDKNAEIYREVIPPVNAAARDAVLLVVTDPPDQLAYLTRKLAGHDRVISTGTLLDSLRFRLHLGRKLGVAPTAIEAQVLGEHGTSQIFHWGRSRRPSDPKGPTRSCVDPMHACRSQSWPLRTRSSRWVALALLAI